LAIKMVLLQFIGVNVQLYFNARFLKFSFWKYFRHQLLSIGCLLATAILATSGAAKVLVSNESIFQSFLLAGLFYTVMVFCLIYYFPVVAGFKKDDIQSTIQKFKEKIRREK